MRVAALAAAMLSALLGFAAPVAARPAAAAGSCDDLAVQSGEQVTQTEDPSAPLDLMRVARAQQLAPPLAQSGVTVAVLDSGISPGATQIRVVARTSLTGRAQVDDAHGTAVASIVAGATRPGGGLLGVAPGAGIVDVRVFDRASGNATVQDGATPTPEALARGLTWVARHASELHIKVATVAVVVPPSEALQRAVAAATEAGVVVVAPTGTRGDDGPMSAFAEPVRGEDAGAAAFPAGYDELVVGVNATAQGIDPDAETGAVSAIVANSATDVAAPSYGVVVATPNGSTCTLLDVRTDWAAAEVSGVLALLWARFPGESPVQITARLLATASGSLEVRTPLAGAGVVQPVEALTRPVSPDARGAVSDTRSVREETPRVRAPGPIADPLVRLRRAALWTAVFGGAALAVALLVRPLISRRRP